MGKIKDLWDFEKGQIVGMQRAGASVLKMAQLVGCSRASVLKKCTRTGTEMVKQRTGSNTAKNSEGLKSEVTHTGKCMHHCSMANYPIQQGPTWNSICHDRQMANTTSFLNEGSSV